MRIIHSCIAALFLLAGCGRERLIVVAPEVAPQATFFAADETTLLPGPLLDLQNQGRSYLLWLQPDSLLHFFRTEAGLVPKAAPYGGWESEDVWGVGPLRGGFMGYYLSGLSLMYRTTGDRELLQRLEYTLSELEACQQAGGDGYVLAIDNGRELFRRVASGEIRTDNPTVNGSWAPLYLIDKMLRGFAVAYVEAGERRALRLMTGLADWFGYGVLDKLTDEQIQKLLVCEHGSINESFLHVYALTGEPRYLAWAGRLNDRSMWVPLSENRDILNGWHANTQIPKFYRFRTLFRLYGRRALRSGGVEFLGDRDAASQLGDRRKQYRRAFLSGLAFRGEVDGAGRSRDVQFGEHDASDGMPFCPETECPPGGVLRTGAPEPYPGSL